MSVFKTTWPLIIFFYSILLPPEVFFEIAGLRFYAFRIVEFVLAPYIIIQVIQSKIRFTFADILNLFGALWIVISYSVIHDVAFALESGAVLAADILIAYFLARCFIRNITDLRVFLYAIIPGIAFSALFLMVESISHQLILRPFFGSGAGGDFALRNEIRFGLLRAYGPFYHPIMAGMFLISLLPLYMLGMKRGSIRNGGILSSLGALFSMSSSAMLGIILIFGLFFYDKLQKFVVNLSWKLFCFVTIAILILLHVSSENGIIAVLNRYLLLNPATGYYRTLIWEYAGAEALRHPIFGIGRNDWLRPVWISNGTIDAHFLLMAVRHGLPAALATFSVYIIAIVSLSNQIGTSRNSEYRNACLGLVVSLITVLILQFTVAAVLASQAILMIILGASISIMVDKKQTTGKRKAKRPRHVAMRTLIRTR